MNRALGVGALLAGLLAPACGTPNGGGTQANEPLHPPAARAGDWPVGTPEEVGLDTSRLTALTQRLRRGELGMRHSLLIARGGRLVVEEYFGVSGISDVHTMQSVTKS